MSIEKKTGDRDKKQETERKETGDKDNFWNQETGIRRQEKKTKTKDKRQKKKEIGTRNQDNFEC
ncbi:MAG: hypothetical protein U5K51_08785 [Flavobacteriaceae bacterium]|nr:hypothetical protein [Flavobacteriaceae bacterium]